MRMIFDRACEISCGNPQFIFPASENTLSNEREKALFVRKEWNHLKIICTSFCLIRFFYLKCQKPFEDRLKSYQYVFHFQYRLKSRPLTDFSEAWLVNRAYSSSLLRAIIACNHLPFFKIFSNFVHFCPNFQIFCPFLALFLKNRTHALTL